MIMICTRRADELLRARSRPYFRNIYTMQRGSAALRCREEMPAEDNAGHNAPRNHQPVNPVARRFPTESVRAKCATPCGT